jgi:hypothetical protein
MIKTCPDPTKLKGGLTIFPSEVKVLSIAYDWELMLFYAKFLI